MSWLGHQLKVHASGLPPHSTFAHDTLRVDRADLMRLPCVAHSFTVHAEESESDYFTVVDDLKRRVEGDDAGSAGIFDMELTSGLYYGYAVVDVPLLTA